MGLVFPCNAVRNEIFTISSFLALWNLIRVHRSNIDGSITGSRLRWSIPTKCAIPQSDNRFRTKQRHCRRKWRLADTDLCPCGKTQTMSRIVKSCPVTKLNGSLSRLHSADEDAVSWLTSYGSWHAHEKKKKARFFWRKANINRTASVLQYYVLL